MFTFGVFSPNDNSLVLNNPTSPIVESTSTTLQLVSDDVTSFEAEFVGTVGVAAALFIGIKLNVPNIDVALVNPVLLPKLKVLAVVQTVPALVIDVVEIDDVDTLLRLVDDVFGVVIGVIVVELTADVKTVFTVGFIPLLAEKLNPILPLLVLLTILILV